MTATGEYSNVEYVFEPHASTMPNLREYVEALWARRQFMAQLAQSDLRTLRSSTALGSIWAVLEPLFQATIYFFLYAVLRGGNSSQLQFLPIMIGDIFLFGLTHISAERRRPVHPPGQEPHAQLDIPTALLPVTSVYQSLFRQFVAIACVFAVLFPLLGGSLRTRAVRPPAAVRHPDRDERRHRHARVDVRGADAGWHQRDALRAPSPLLRHPGHLPGDHLARQRKGPRGLATPLRALRELSGGVQRQMPSPGLVFQAALWAAALRVIGGRLFLEREREFTIHL